MSADLLAEASEIVAGVAALDPMAEAVTWSESLTEENP